VQGIDQIPADAMTADTYRLEWWFAMQNTIPDLVKREIMTCPFTRTSEMGWATPDSSKIFVLVSDDADRNLPAVKSEMEGVLVLIHDTEEIEPDPDFQGGFGRMGRQVRCKVSVIARGVGRLDTTVETSKTYLGYLAEDLKDEFDPVGGVNTLAGYCYETHWRMTIPPQPLPAMGEDAAVVQFEIDCFKMQYTEGEAPPFIAGDGILFNFNQPMMDSTVLMNDHGYVYVEETGYYHKIGIQGADLAVPSEYFDHWRSKDLRTWELLDPIQVGTGVVDNWRYIVFAASPIRNPNYGGAGPYSTYKYLMTYTGVSRHPGDQASKEKIGLLGTTSTSLNNGTWVQIGPAGVGDDNPVYWSGMATATYPSGPPWCPTSLYNANWGGASRDSELWTDGNDWYLLCTCKYTGGPGEQALAWAKCGGGAQPDLTDWEHEAEALVECEDTGLHFESAQLITYDGRHFLFYTGTGGTRVQSSTTAPVGAARPFSGDRGAGNLVNNTGPTTMLANNQVFVEGAGAVTYIGGHNLVPGSNCWIALQELDYATLISDPTDGDYPTETSQYGIGGLVGWSEGVMDRSLRWTIEDSEGPSGAFYNQPVWGDQAAAAGYDPSGMTGNSYIATHFRHRNPGDGLDGLEYADYTRQGWIKSSNFEITRNRMELYVAGGSDISESFIALVRADTDQVLFRETGTGDHTLTQRIWDLTDLRSETSGRGLQVYLAIVDQGTDAGDCIDVDAIREYEKVGADPVTPSTPEESGPTLASLITIGS